MTQHLFVEPLDVLYLRGNRLFEGAGAHGEALMPPWPSLAAGAIRSRMLADAGVDFNAFARGERLGDAAFDSALGTPADPGEFRITSFTLARSIDGRIEARLPLPADVVVADGKGLSDANYLQPRALPVTTSAALPLTPVLRSAAPAKPVSGLWLTETGFQAWLANAPIEGPHVISSNHLWLTDPRLGIALDAHARTTAVGMLYTAETVALTEHTGFLVGVEGADSLLPKSGLLRFGGDGRGAAVKAVDIPQPGPDWARIERDGRFRLVLSTPGLFPQGWQPPGVDAHGAWQGPLGVSARLVSAAVPRAGVVSGWDLAQRRPKAAQRVAPTGSVYWFEEFKGNRDGLRRLVAEGLWACMADNECDSSRRAEGFNNVQIAAWPRD